MLRSMDAALTKKVVGDAITKLRERKGWNQAELAEAVGIHSETVGKHERGAIGMSLATAITYADVLGASLDAMSGLAAQRDSLVQVVRPGPLFVVADDDLDAILVAKTHQQIRSRFRKGYGWGSVVGVFDRLVVEQQYRARERRIEEKMRALGPFPRGW